MTATPWPARTLTVALALLVLGHWGGFAADAAAQTVAVTIDGRPLTAPAGRMLLAVTGANGFNTGVFTSPRTLALEAGTYYVRTTHGHVFGSFTLSDAGGGLMVTAVDGAVTITADGIGFDLSRLVALRIINAPLSNPVGNVPVALTGLVNTVGVPANGMTVYAPAGTFAVTTARSQPFGDITIADADGLGTLAVAGTTGAVTATPTADGADVGFDLAMLFAVTPVWSTLSDPPGLIEVQIQGFGNTLNGPLDAVTFYVPAGTYSVSSQHGDAFGTFTVTGDFGSLAITGTTGALEPTPTGVAPVTSDLHHVLVEPLAPVPPFAVFGVSRSVSAPAHLYLPPGDYNAGTGDTVSTRFRLDASGLTMLEEPTPPQAVITLVVPSSDITAPEIVATVSGPLGREGWYIGDVMVTFEVTDPESPFTAGPGCEPHTVTTDTPAVTFSCEATSGGGTASAEVTIARDATAPVITAVSASPDRLWPPDHRLQEVVLTVTAEDTIDASPQCAITSVRHDEMRWRWSQRTKPDWIIVEPLTVQLRRERSGHGNGRVYTIGVACTDTAGNPSAHSEVAVLVPHDRRHH